MAVHQLLDPLPSQSTVQNKRFHLVGLCNRNRLVQIILYNVFRKWLPCPRCNSARNAPCFGISSWTDAPRCWGRFSKMIILLESWQEIFENFLKQFMNIHWENIKDGFRSEYKLLKADQWIDQGELYDYNSVMHYLSLEYSKG